MHAADLLAMFDKALTLMTIGLEAGVGREMLVDDFVKDPSNNEIGHNK